MKHRQSNCPARPHTDAILPGCGCRRQSFGPWEITIGVMVLGPVLLLAGCQPAVKSPEMFSVSGTITIDGEPVPRGEIFFQPDSESGNSGPASTGIIQDSRYTIDRKRGIVGGAYEIRITGYQSPGGQNAVLPEEFGAPLFKEYIVRQQLDKKTQELNFDVPASQRITPKK